MNNTILTVNVRWLGQKARATVLHGEVMVYDTVAGHFTTCHSLTPTQERSVRSRIAKLAR